MAFDLSKLGIKKNIPKVSFLEYSGIFEAPEKFGKTAFAALLPNSVILAAEVGYKAQVVDYINITKWDDLVDFVDGLEEHREEIGDSIKTIVIDTVDELHPMAADYIVRKQSIKDKTRYVDVKDIPYGQGWNYWDTEFKTQIKRIQNMGFNILYLTHSLVKQHKPKNGEPYDIYKSTMSDRCAAVVYPSCDFIIHGERRSIEINGNKVMTRALVVRGTEEAIAGNRVYFDEDIIFDSEEEAIEKFQAKFREGIKRNLLKAGITTDLDVLEKQQKEERKEKVSEYIKKAQSTDEVITEIKSLIDALEMTDDIKSALASIFKEETGSKNYTRCKDVVALQRCVERIKSL